MSLLSHRAGAGPPLVLLHGIGSSWRDWRPVLPFLEAAHQTFALTFPGHRGGPPAGADASSLGGLADAVLGELDRLGLARPHVAGSSLGGRVALELASRGRAASVVALSPPGMGTAAERSWLRARLLRNHRLARVIQPLAALVERSPAFAQLVAGRVQVRGRVDPVEAAHKLRALADCPVLPALVADLCRRGPERLGEIACPVAIAWGERDPLLPASHAGRFAAAIPGSEVVILAAAGHLPMWDDPAGVAALVRRVAAGAGIRHAGGS